MTSSRAYGIVTESNAAAFLAYNPPTDTFTLVGTSNASGFSSYFLLAENYSGKFTVENLGINDQGAAYFAGGTSSAKGTMLRTTGVSGNETTAYGENATKPELEDVGDAEIVNGRAVVKFDPAIVDVIDARSTYHVLMTPDGECNGLYVDKRLRPSPSYANCTTGTRRSRSNIASWRSRFISMVNGSPTSPHRTRPAPASAASASRPNNFRYLSPEQRLKNRIGTEAYAKHMLTLKNKLTAP